MAPGPPSPWPCDPCKSDSALPLQTSASKDRQAATPHNRQCRRPSADSRRCQDSSTLARSSSGDSKYCCYRPSMMRHNAANLDIPRASEQMVARRAATSAHLRMWPAHSQARKHYEWRDDRGSFHRRGDAPHHEASFCPFEGKRMVRSYRSRTLRRPCPRTLCKARPTNRARASM